MASKQKGPPAKKPAAKKKATAGTGGNGRPLSKTDNAPPDGAAPTLFQTVGKGDTDSFVIWEGKIRTAHKSLQADLKLVNKSRSALGDVFASAKEAGIPAGRLNALKKRLKEELRDPADVVAEAKEIAWQESVSKTHKLSDLGLFHMAEPSLEAWERIGYEAGLKGEVQDNAPGKPGEDKHTHYLNGWKRGQRELVEKSPLFDKGDQATREGAAEFD